MKKLKLPANGVADAINVSAATAKATVYEFASGISDAALVSKLEKVGNEVELNVQDSFNDSLNRLIEIQKAKKAEKKAKKKSKTKK